MALSTICQRLLQWSAGRRARQHQHQTDQKRLREKRAADSEATRQREADWRAAPYPRLPAQGFAGRANGPPSPVCYEVATSDLVRYFWLNQPHGSANPSPESRHEAPQPVPGEEGASASADGLSTPCVDPVANFSSSVPCEVSSGHDDSHSSAYDCGPSTYGSGGSFDPSPSSSDPSF